MSSGSKIVAITSSSLIILHSESSPKRNLAPQDEDPLVSIRKQELALKGQELAIEQQQFVASENRKAQDSARRAQIDRERIGLTEEIAEMRDDTARARLEQQRLMKAIDLQNRQ